MRDTIRDEAPVGTKSGDYSPPPELHVITGLVDDRRTVLEPGDAVFDLFAWVRSVQDGWTHAEHGAFWHASLDLWPPGRGGPKATETLAWCFKAHRRAGRDAEQSAAAMGYAVDDLRRMGVLRLADDLSTESVEYYFLPRVYAPTLDAHPDPMAYPNLSAERLSQPSARSAALSRGLS